MQPSAAVSRKRSRSRRQAARRGQRPAGDDARPSAESRATSSRCTRFRGRQAQHARFDDRAKRSRSTASAPPAGTALSRADVTISESEPREFFFEQADGVFERGAAQRVAADELGQRARFVCAGPLPVRTHLVTSPLDAAARRLPRGFAARRDRRR